MTREDVPGCFGATQERVEQKHLIAEVGRV